MTDENQGDTNVATRQARHYINDMLEEAGFDPETTAIADVEVVNGELRLTTTRQQSTPVQRAMAEAVCQYERENEFAEVKCQGVTAAVFGEGEEIVVEAERDGETVGRVELTGELVSLIQAARDVGNYK